MKKSLLEFRSTIAQIYLVVLLLASSFAFAQPTVLGTSLANNTYTTTTLNTVGGFKQLRVLAASSAATGTRTWEFATGTGGSPVYSTNWRPYTGGNTMSVNTFIPTSFANGAKYNTGGGGASGLLPAITSGRYYTFNVSNNATADNAMSLLETTFDPVGITSVTHTTGTVGSRIVSISTAATPSAGENIFVRYSTNSYTSSTIIQATGSGTTWTASIPVQSGTVSFYVYSSNKSLANVNTDVTTNGQQVHDMYTLNLNNNAGANYSYVANAGSITYNPITGTNPNTANPYTTGIFVTTNATASGIGRGSGIAGASANDRYTATGWDSGAINLNDYFEFTITPNATYRLNFTELVYIGQASGTGPTSFALRSSVDGFTANIGTPTASGTTISLTAGTFQALTTATTFRLYGWGASAAGGTFSVNDYTFNGTVDLIPAAPFMVISGTTAHGSSCPTVAATPQTYTITNNGTVTATGVTVVSNDSQFVVSGLSSTTITSGGGTATYNVTFTPSSGGAKSATITVASVTSGSNSPTSALTGFGTSPITADVTTSAATLVSNTTATLNGNVISLGVCPSTTQKGFVYSQTSVNNNPLNGGTGVTTTPVALVTAGAYNLPLTSLATGTSYTFKAYVYDGTNYTYGATLTFTTLLPADHLTFVGVPTTGNTGTNLTSFTVQARRPDNSVDATYTGSITIAKNSGPGTLSGTLSVSAVAGVATFGAAQFDTVGTVSLAASAVGLTGDISGNIVISLAPVSLGSWDFSPLTGGLNNYGPSPLSPTNTAANVTVGGLTRGSGVTVINTGAFNAWGGNGWESTNSEATAITANSFATFTIQSNAGYELSLGSLSAYNVRRSGTGPSTGQWQYSINGGAYANIGSAITWGAITTAAGNPQSSIALSGISQLQNLAPGAIVTFRIVNFGGNSNWYLNDPLDTTPADFGINGNAICVQPVLFNVTGGGTTCATGAGLPIGLSGSQVGVSYQLKLGGINNGAPVAGTGAAISFGNHAAGGTYTVEASNTNGTCNLTLTMTGNAVVVADPASSPGTVSADQAICAGSQPANITLTGTITGTIQWQSSTDNITFTNINGETSATLTGAAIGNLTQTTYFHAVVTSGVCAPATSGVVTVTVASTTWDGNAWSNGTPTSTKGIVITGDYTSSGDLEGCSMTVTNNADVIIATGDNLTLNGALNVDSGSTLTVQNNANLIQSQDVANTGNITVNRNSNALMRLDYTLWSSPVDSQNLLAFSPLTIATRFYTYNPATDVYNAIVPSTNSFGEGIGYLIRMPDNHPTVPTVWNGSFTGTPRNGDVDLTVTNGTYNAVGNPYPSAIDADAFINENNLTEALYFWRKTNNAATTSYATYTLAGGAGTNPNAGDPLGLIPNGTIQVGQGFIAKSTSTTLSFNNTMRVPDNNGQFFRASQVERNRIWLNLTNAEGIFSQTMVAYMTGATQGVDAKIDGLFFNDSEIALTSVIEGSEYAVQGRALPFADTDVVPLGFKAVAAGSYTIALDHADGLFADDTQDIYLKDNTDNSTHDLRAGSYTFAAEAGVFNNRFEIVYQSTLGVNNPTFDANQVVVYKQGQDIVINSGKATMATVKVFDIRGRLLVEQQNVNASETKVFAGSTNEMLVVKIIDKDGTEVSKKVIN